MAIGAAGARGVARCYTDVGSSVAGSGAVVYSIAVVDRVSAAARPNGRAAEVLVRRAPITDGHDRRASNNLRWVVVVDSYDLPYRRARSADDDPLLGAGVGAGEEPDIVRSQEEHGGNLQRRATRDSSARW
jgi:hypothetical protein